MTFSIGIRTYPRTLDYCRCTLSRLLHTGTLQHPLVKGLHLAHGADISPNANGCRALRMAAKDSARWVVAMEDDVDIIDDFIPSLVRWLIDFATPQQLFYPLSCFYPGAIAANTHQGAWLDYPISEFYGSQGFVMRTADALDFARWVPTLGLSFERDVSLDLRLAEWHLLRSPIQHLRTPAPCFLDHIGEFSAIGPPGSWERVGKVVGFDREHKYGG